MNGPLCPVYARPMPISKLHGKSQVLSWQGEHLRAAQAQSSQCTLCLSRAPSAQVLRALRASQRHREGLTSSLCQDTEHHSGCIAGLLCLALGTPAKRGARFSLCCARRLQPCLQVVEYLPCFPLKNLLSKSFLSSHVSGTLISSSLL